jgi:hypothetical protein
VIVIRSDTALAEFSKTAFGLGRPSLNIPDLIQLDSYAHRVKTQIFLRPLPAIGNSDLN